MGHPFAHAPSGVKLTKRPKRSNNFISEIIIISRTNWVILLYNHIPRTNLKERYIFQLSRKLFFKRN